MRKLIIVLVFGLAACGQQSRSEVNSEKRWFCDGEHQHCLKQNYAYPQFNLSTNIGEFAGFSDVLEAGPPLEHYQTLLAEVVVERADTNAVAFWSDANSQVNKGRVWGGFMSARSGLPDEENFDSQLIGLEIDILNGGLPGVAPNSSKVGLQIVGFGQPNTNAIEILSEGPNSGRWYNGINIQEGAISEKGTAFGLGPQTATVGIDFRRSTFTDGAFLLSSGAKIAWSLEGQHDAAIYRDDIEHGYLVLQAGPEGLRITNSEDSETLVTILPDGDIVTKYGKLSEMAARLDVMEHRLQKLER